MSYLPRKLSWKYLAGVLIPDETIEGLRIRKADVVGLVDTTHVNLRCDDIVYENIPVWIHTDIGARYTYYSELISGTDAQLDDGADYFRDSALLFPIGECTPIDGSWGTLITDFTETVNGDFSFDIDDFTFNTIEDNNFDVSILSSLDDNLGYVLPAYLSVVTDAEDNIISVTVDGTLLTEEEYLAYDTSTIALFISEFVHTGDNAVILPECIKEITLTTITLCESLIARYQSIDIPVTIAGVRIAMKSTGAIRVYAICRYDSINDLYIPIGVIGMTPFEGSYDYGNPTYRPYLRFTISADGETTYTYLYDIINDEAAQVPSIIGGEISLPYLTLDTVATTDTSTMTALTAFTTDAITPTNFYANYIEIIPVGAEYVLEEYYYANTLVCTVDEIAYGCTFSEIGDSGTCANIHTISKEHSTGQGLELGTFNLLNGTYSYDIVNSCGNGSAYYYKLGCDIYDLSYSGAWSSSFGNVSYSSDTDFDENISTFEVTSSLYSEASFILSEISGISYTWSYYGGTYSYTDAIGNSVETGSIFTNSKIFGAPAEYSGQAIDDVDITVSRSYYIRYYDGSNIYVKTGINSSGYEDYDYHRDPTPGLLVDSTIDIQWQSEISVTVAVTDKDGNTITDSPYLISGSASYTYIEENSVITSNYDTFSRELANSKIFAFNYPNLICNPIAQGLLMRKFSSTGSNHVEGTRTYGSTAFVGSNTYDSDGLVTSNNVFTFIESAVTNILDNVYTNVSLPEITITTNFYLVSASVKELYLRDY